MERLHRKCPKCGSVKGFRVTYVVFGKDVELRNFKGKLYHTISDVRRNPDSIVDCLDCGKSIKATRVQLET